MIIRKLAVFCTAIHMTIGLEWGVNCPEPGQPAPSVCNPDNFLECKHPFNLTDLVGKCGCQGTNTAWTVVGNPPIGSCGLQVGATCGAPGIQCAYPSTCNTALRCQCPPLHNEITTLDRGEKVCRAALNTPCNVAANDVLCNSDIGLTCQSNGENPSADLCLCKPNTVWDNHRFKCVSIVDYACVGAGVLNPVSDGDDSCVKNAECNGSTCVCQTGYAPATDSKSCLRKFDGPCASDSDCNADLHHVCGPTSKKCECGPSYALHSPDTCRLRAEAGPCSTHVECQSDYCHPELAPGAAGKCLCREESQVQLSDGTCSANTEHCYFDHTCGAEKICDYNLTPAGSIYGKCKCRRGIGEGAQTCQMKVDEECLSEQNCVQNAVCTEGTCKCKSSYSKTNDGYCGLTHGSSPCNPAQSPTGGCNGDLGLICTASLCDCPVGQVWDEEEAGRCVALVGGSCEMSANSCTKNAHCTEAGVCACDDGSTHTGISMENSHESERKCHKTHAEVCHPDSDPCNALESLKCVAGATGNVWTCQCLYAEQQEWDNSTSKCRSVNGGFCGSVLEENSVGGTDEFNATCVEGAKCVADKQGIFTCVCDDATIAIGEVCTKESVTDSATCLTVMSLFTIIAISKLVTF